MTFPEDSESNGSALFNEPLNETFYRSSFDRITAYFLAQVGEVQSQTPMAQQKDYAEQTAQAVKMAGVIADFIGKAKKSIHIAIYHFLLSGHAENLVVDAINKAAKGGISVRIAYNRREIEKTSAQRGRRGIDAAALTTNDRMTQQGYLDEHIELHAIEDTEVDDDPETLPEIHPPAELEDIEHASNIMHSKYIIRDGEAVLTGSANFTDGAWSLQENNVLIFENAAALASCYEANFDDLWTTDSIKGSGEVGLDYVNVGSVPVTVGFSPGDGSLITEEIVQAINKATKRLLVASMVISSLRILESIQSLKARSPQGVRVLIDQMEMRNAVIGHWRRSRNPASAEKLQFWEVVSEGFEGKKSEPYVNGQNDWPHNFMHNKFIVADDIVVTGSFNFSQNAEKNAENVLIIQDQKLADAYAIYFDQIYRRYSSQRDPFNNIGNREKFTYELNSHLQS